MKKILSISFVAAVAVITLCSAASAVLQNDHSRGTIQFESTAIPALNCTMSVAHADAIYQMIPDEVASVCRSEYERVKSKCNLRGQFVYQGVNVSCSGADPALNIEFKVPGHKLRVKNVSWKTLDEIFKIDEW